MRRLVREESGFTIIEMLVSCALGLIVLGTLGGLVSTAQQTASRTSQRADAAQRGRLAMEQLVQGLRSQVCLQTDASSAQTTIVAGTDTSVTFFAGVDSPNTAATGGLPKAFAPQKRTYTFSSSGTGSITLATYDGTFDGASGLWTFPGTASRNRTIIDTVAARAQTGTSTPAPVFSYYAYKADGTLDEDNPLPTPLAETDLPRVAQIAIAFTSLPTGGSKNPDVQAPFDDNVTLRLLFPAPKTALQNRTAACVI
jgi:type II secretory pathway pseudopilin PulG